MVKTCGKCFWFEFLYADKPFKVGNCIAGGFNTYNNECAAECDDFMTTKGEV
jgi:hypothetical protein